MVVDARLVKSTSRVISNEKLMKGRSAGATPEGRLDLEILAWLRVSIDGEK